MLTRCRRRCRRAVPSPRPAAMSYELYRQTNMGEALVESLEELVHEGKITAELAQEVLKKFDTVG